MGKLRGIVLTPELRSVIDAVLVLPQLPSVSSAAKGEASSVSASSRRAGNDDGRPSEEASSSSSSPKSMSASSPSVLLERARGAKREMTSRAVSYSSAGEAASAVRAAIRPADPAADDAPPSLSLAGLDPIRFLIGNSRGTSPDDDGRSGLHKELEGALRRACLSFAPDVGGGPTATKSPPGGGGGDPAFEKRLESLRLQDEERSYKKLTTNLKTLSSLKGDDVTAKSMMYAASIGLNMIVAPVTFGVFMYFFAGGIFGRFFDDDTEEDADGRRRGRGGGGVDVRRVIAGVVSGVFMLFVEMILFVIRSHELDASVTKKGRKRENRANPFGYTEKSMARVYVRED
jgi:hypothetical protein